MYVLHVYVIIRASTLASTIPVYVFHYYFQANRTPIDKCKWIASSSIQHQPARVRIIDSCDRYYPKSGEKHTENKQIVSSDVDINA